MLEHDELLSLIGINLSAWMEHLMFNALEYGFIHIGQIKEAKKIIVNSNCTSMDQFYDTFSEQTKDNELLGSLVNATQL